MKHGGMAKHVLFEEESAVWYVLQVRSGTEEKIRTQCRKMIDSVVLEQCFVPYYEEKKKYRGAWHIEQRLLFPGYVFLISARLSELRINLKKIIGMRKLLGTGEEIVPLTEEETDLLKKMGIQDGPLEISLGIMENDHVMIMEGPLAGMESYIRRIDRHKRKTWLEIEMFGRIIKMEAGLEIIKKI